MRARITLHLTAADGELLDGIALRIALAQQQLAEAERDRDVASMGMAASRGFRGAQILGRGPSGLVIDVPIDLAADATERA